MGEFLFLNSGEKQRNSRMYDLLCILDLTQDLPRTLTFYRIPKEIHSLLRSGMYSNLYFVSGLVVVVVVVVVVIVVNVLVISGVFSPKKALDTLVSIR